MKLEIKNEEENKMLKTSSRAEELKNTAVTLIGMEAVPNVRRQLAKIIVNGIDDDFVPAQATDWEIDEYLRDRALNFWFYPTMHVNELVPRLAEEIKTNWEIKVGDDRMLADCLATVMSYQPTNFSLDLGTFLKLNVATADLATVAGFDVEKINQVLVEHEARVLPV
jgi:hypothetical protein